MMAQHEKMRTITLEEHYSTRAFLEGPGRRRARDAQANLQAAAKYAQLTDLLCDLGEGRIASMDAAGIDVQVLSLGSPGVE